jgi:hypothetical protein
VNTAAKLPWIIDTLQPAVVAERAAPRSSEGLILITRCTQVGEKKAWAYEALELWKDGFCRPFLLRSSWLAGMGLSRKVHSPFGHFDGGEYLPVNAEAFAQLLGDWLKDARFPDAARLLETFRTVAQGQPVSLNLANEVDYSKPMGI